MIRSYWALVNRGGGPLATKLMIICVFRSNEKAPEGPPVELENQFIMRYRCSSIMGCRFSSIMRYRCSSTK